MRLTFMLAFMACAIPTFAGQTNDVSKASSAPSAPSIPSPKPEYRTVYMVELDIRNSSFSLDLGKHIRNAMNAMQIEIPVDKKFYDAVKPNTEVAKSFKTASFIMKGSVSSIKVTCVRKWTVKEKVKK